VLVCKAGLFPETFGGEVVFVPVFGDGGNGDITSGDEVFNVGVYKAQGDAEVFTQVALGSRGFYSGRAG
jgi:hypothetical protein